MGQSTRQCNGMADSRIRISEGSSSIVSNLGNIAVSYQQLLGRGHGSSKGRDAKDGLIFFLEE